MILYKQGILIDRNNFQVEGVAVKCSKDSQSVLHVAEGLIQFSGVLVQRVVEVNILIIDRGKDNAVGSEILQLPEVDEIVVIISRLCNHLEDKSARRGSSVIRGIRHYGDGVGFNILDIEEKVFCLRVVPGEFYRIGHFHILEIHHMIHFWDIYGSR